MTLRIVVPVRRLATIVVVGLMEFLSLAQSSPQTIQLESLLNWTTIDRARRPRIGGGFITWHWLQT